jgi:hydrogenase-4 component I
MKLTKISLATIVALGAFSSVASATPLEEAIKNVDLSGYARYRYDTSKTKKADGTKSAHKATHRFTSVLSFKAALDDNFFGVMGLRYNSRDGSGKTKATQKDFYDQTDTKSTFAVSEIYLGYKAGNTTLTAGRQTLGTYFTDDMIGTGLKVLNSDIQGLTLAAVAFDDLEGGDNGWGISNKLPDIVEENKAKLGVTGSQAVERILSNNLYGVAAIGSYDPVSFQLWYASLVDVANLIAADVSANFNVAQDVSVGVQAQYGHGDVDSGLRSLLKNALNDANLYTFQVSSSLYGADLALGYVGYKVKEYDVGLVTLDDQGSFNDAGEIKGGLDYTALHDKGTFFYAKAGYKIDKVGLGVDLLSGSVKDEKGDKTKYNEWVARASYAYSKKLSFSSFYAYQTEKENSGKNKENQFRFQAKYAF